jgi:hypothetical protein
MMDDTKKRSLARGLSWDWQKNIWSIESRIVWLGPLLGKEMQDCSSSKEP